MSKIDPKDIIKSYKDAAENARTFPKTPKSASRAIDFIIATKYLRNMILQFLSIYKSLFGNPDGGRGAIRKLQQIFKNIKKKTSKTSKDNIRIIFFQTNIFCTEIDTK